MVAKSDKIQIEYKTDTCKNWLNLYGYNWIVNISIAF